MEIFDQLHELIMEAADEFESLQQTAAFEREEFLAADRRLQVAERFIRDAGLWNDYEQKEGDDI